MLDGLNAGPTARGQVSRRSGAALAVIGTKGAPGTSECAASLAERWPAVLVELDALGGALDLRFAGGPRRGGLLELVRAAGSADGVVGELLERWLADADGWPPVLLGPPEFERDLSELAHPGAVSNALAALRSHFPLIICDLGFLLAEGMHTGPAACIHREALLSADAVVLVIGARGQQIGHGIAQLGLLLGPLALPPERVFVVVNGCGGPASVSRQSLELTFAAALAEGGLAVNAWLPWDKRALARTARRGYPLARAHLRGPYARALTGLLDQLRSAVPGIARAEASF
ncbi:hypothetical protein Gocc_0276 [Gaiella occulta]|uniref:MinD-like ATPase involved in chromosome partitioning or flagellar assembly n=1 Tax=Gaiella occulta TaxID=1002870 RepID=A0A7M2Z0M5_9ACTN|nr:hypothetical protein Gocc_0276 [Gaiella occulta]